jgi:hypothetical protein
MYFGEVLLLAITLSIVAGLAWYARAIAPFVRASPNVPSGIGGWLILPAFGLVAGPIVLLIELMVVAQLVLPEIEPGSLEYTYILANSVASGALGAFAIYVAFQFFARSRAAPRLVIALMALGLVGGAGFLLLGSLLFKVAMFNSDTAPAFFVTAVQASVWIPYFYVSARVRNTFVR